MVEQDQPVLKVWVDLTTYCNASCPQCHRTDVNGLGKAKWLPLQQWTFENFVERFPYESVKHIRDFEFCGTWGDPAMNKDLVKICNYIIDNSESTIHINTNGGTRSTDWWYELGNKGKSRVTCYFDVDGINQEMHAKYRKKVELQKVLDNMEAFSEGGGITKTFIVLFKHNQEHVHDIIKMTRMYGSKFHYVIRSDRFIKSNKFHYVTEDGQEEYLEEIDRDMNHIIQNPWIASSQEYDKEQKIYE